MGAMMVWNGFLYWYHTIRDEIALRSYGVPYHTIYIWYQVVWYPSRRETRTDF